MSHTVIGIFEYRSEAQEARQYLIDHGFKNSDIDVNTSSTASDDRLTVPGETTNKHTSDDSIGGFFRNLFGNDEDEDHINRHIEAGRKGTVLTVYTQSSDEANQVADILDNYGAVDVNEFTGRSDSTGKSSAKVPETTVDSLLDNTTDPSVGLTADPEKIQVIQESLHVGKREVETRGVRLRSKIVQRPVEENIRLRHENVTVKRMPVDRPATEADFIAFKEGTIELSEHSEIPVVLKEARVVEEISLKKEVSEEEEIIHDTLRRTEVYTEDINAKEKL